MTDVAPARFDTLAGWLDWQEALHATAMDLGLERVRQVAQRMDWPPRQFPLITVAGTNGKGSTVAYMESTLVADGRRVGTYSSPHLVHYNERIRLGGLPCSDDEIMRSFARLDTARADTTLTYFEFGTLAAMDIFVRLNVDVAVMEVGIGGRLDAVNVFDPTVAVLTAIDVDHQKWLGKDREAIGLEKAGIFRSNQPAVMVDRKPPQSVSARADGLGVALYVLGRDFEVSSSSADWCWRGPARELSDLPRPSLQGDFQLDNAAGAIMALELLGQDFQPKASSVSHGLTNPGLHGRFEQIHSSPDVWVDVGHNAHATVGLADNLARTRRAGRTIAVAAMLVEKDIERALSPLIDHFDEWHVAGLSGPRGDDGSAIAQTLSAARVGHLTRHADGLAAYHAALQSAGPNDRIVAFGSFYLVGDILAAQADSADVAVHE